MISITKCKKILNKNGVSYTDEEISMIRNVLYKFAEVVLTISEQEKLILLNESFKLQKEFTKHK